VRPLRGGIIQSGLPKSFAVCPIQTYQRAAVLLFERLREIDSIARDNRSRVAPLGQRHAPANILRAAPLQRKRLLVRDAVGGGTPPVRPVTGSQSGAKPRQCT